MPDSRKPNRGPSAAAENRAALISAARKVFGERGADAPLSAIARAAGVGQGSLYRHFPNRVSIVLAVFDQNMEQLGRLAADPETTVWDLADAITHEVEGNAGLIDFLMREHAEPKLEEFSTRLHEMVEPIWTRSWGAGELAKESTLDQFMFAISMISAVVTRAPASERHAHAVAAWALLRPALKGRGGA